MLAEWLEYNISCWIQSHTIVMVQRNVVEYPVGGSQSSVQHFVVSLRELYYNY